MDFLIWVLGGGVIGLIAAGVTGADRPSAWLLPTTFGICGAVLTGWLILPALGMPTINEGRFSVGAGVVSMVGAVAAVVFGSAVRWNKQRGAR